jgi:DNA polymerase III gamma/tau subunit
MAKATKGSEDPAIPYRVLARKYRPVDFTTLVGQEAMVRTLRNAIATGRIAHAFMLTGVRGVGKTTTARIIARALNCVPTAQAARRSIPAASATTARPSPRIAMST